MDSILVVVSWLVSAVMSGFGLLLLLRFLFPVFGVNSRNQLVVSVRAYTDGSVAFLAAFLPTVRGSPLVPLVLSWVVSVGKLLILNILSFSQDSFLLIPLLAILDVARLVLDVFFYSVLVLVIQSFVQSPALAMVAEVAMGFAGGLLARIRQVIKPVGVLDFSFWIALVVLRVVDFLILAPWF